jgi:hypothetical protein
MRRDDSAHFCAELISELSSHSISALHLQDLKYISTFRCPSVKALHPQSSLHFIGYSVGAPTLIYMAEVGSITLSTAHFLPVAFFSLFDDSCNDVRVVLQVFIYCLCSLASAVKNFHIQNSDLKGTAKRRIQLFDAKLAFSALCGLLVRR